MRKEVNLIKFLKSKKHFLRLFIQKGHKSIKIVPAITKPRFPKKVLINPIINNTAPTIKVR